MKFNSMIRWVYFFLCTLFIGYSLVLYQASGTPDSVDYDVKKAASGHLVWQKYNCQACHQLYGLGGYLGPDLTNVYSVKTKGPDYIRALIRSGSKQMPGFQLTEGEMNELLEFLKSTDESGVADPREFKTTASGMIQANEKH
ncbi:MAG: cytochrome c [Bacteroidia bacterium]|nr:cytochrome c [Bacteroidia bacterium]